MGWRERSAAIYHHYCCRSVTGSEITGVMTGSRGTAGEPGEARLQGSRRSESTGTGCLVVFEQASKTVMCTTTHSCRFTVFVIGTKRTDVTHW